jgi:hypothetical protein
MKTKEMTAWLSGTALALLLALNGTAQSSSVTPPLRPLPPPLRVNPSPVAPLKPLPAPLPVSPTPPVGNTYSGANPQTPGGANVYGTNASGATQNPATGLPPKANPPGMLPASPTLPPAPVLPPAPTLPQSPTVSPNWPGNSAGDPFSHANNNQSTVPANGQGGTVSPPGAQTTVPVHGAPTPELDHNGVIIKK